ncbi:MAG TPA: hypothetical protein VM075_06840 [Anaerolineae bacterium]|nr:hypothetical protein [Anaerolineae bacterium]
MSDKHRVARSYESPYTVPLAMHKGERLRWEPRECEWPGWIWCATDSGESRWVPESWVEKGETVAVLLMESGWGWATHESGQSGWVPLEYLGRP